MILEIPRSIQCLCIAILLLNPITRLWADEFNGTGASCGTHMHPDAAAHAFPAEAAFLAENTAAMDVMMADMDIKPTGDVDRDFVAMMVPHHQGAIDMAKAVLRYGKNDQIRRLAQEIIVTQQQEIAAMRLAVGDPLPRPQMAPTQIPLNEDRNTTMSVHHHHCPLKQETP
jgi:hypothetical protein